MTMTIDIDDFLSFEEKKELCKEYVRDTLAGNEHSKERVLSNMAYACAFSILDGAITPEMLALIKAKTLEILNDSSSYSVFRRRNLWEAEDSKAYLAIINTVDENIDLIKSLTKKAIVKRDYFKDLPESSDLLSDAILAALKKGLS